MDLVTLLALGALASGAGAMNPSGTRPPSEFSSVLRVQASGAGEEARPVAAQFGDAGRPLAIDRWQPYIAEAARRFGIPEPWIRAVMRAESGGETLLDGRPITSHAGAMGLMQLMPETYAEMSAREGLGSDPYASRDNILAGAGYLRAMYDRYGYPGLFAAYNAGPDRFDAYLHDGVFLPDETWQYLAAISPAVAKAVAEKHNLSTDMSSGAPAVRPRNTSGAGLFFPLAIASGSVANASGQASSSGTWDAGPAPRIGPSGALFVPLRTPQAEVLGAGESQ
jgi:soluble lytic murein transglycosylase-like protein